MWHVGLTKNSPQIQIRLKISSEKGVPEFGKGRIVRIAVIALPNAGTPFSRESIIEGKNPFLKQLITVSKDFFCWLAHYGGFDPCSMFKCGDKGTGA